MSEKQERGADRLEASGITAGAPVVGAATLGEIITSIFLMQEEDLTAAAEWLRSQSDERVAMVSSGTRHPLAHGYSGPLSSNELAQIAALERALRVSKREGKANWIRDATFFAAGSIVTLLVNLL